MQIEVETKVQYHTTLGQKLNIIVNNTTQIVYLVQENPYISVLSAEEYGEIETLFESGSQIMFSPQPAIRKLKRKLKDFNDNDHLLMMGDPAAMGIACCVAAELNWGKF